MGTEINDDMLNGSAPVRPAEAKACKEAKRIIELLESAAKRLVKSKPRGRNQEEWLFILRHAADLQCKIATAKREYGYVRKGTKCKRQESQ